MGKNEIIKHCMDKNGWGGCNSLTMALQTEFFESNGVIKLDTPIISMQPFCNYHKLHLTFVDVIYKDKYTCMHFCNI